MFNAIDLFCGAGGCSEGLIQAGFHILFSSDISDMVEKTYTHRHEQLGLIQSKNTWFELSDIRNLTGDIIRDKISNLEIFQGKDMPEIDLMIGGPSCQGFSMAGRRDRNDPRNMLFSEYVRVIADIKPKYIVLENVSGFMSMPFYGFKGITGKVYPDCTTTPELLKSELDAIGYDTLPPRILNAADYGVPQRRPRVIFMGYRKGLKPPTYPKPTVTKHLTITDAIGDLITDEKIKAEVNPVLTNYQKESIKGRTPSFTSGKPIKSKTYLNTELPNVNDVVSQRFSLFTEGEKSSTLRKRIMTNGIDISKCPALIKLCADQFKMTEKAVVELFKNGHPTEEQINTLLTKKNIRTRYSSKDTAPTVVTNPDDYISPWEPRTLSVRELARCQSFDDSFEFLGKRTTGGLRRRVEVPQYTQVGNAVPPLLAKAVALEIKRVLENP